MKGDLGFIMRGAIAANLVAGAGPPFQKAMSALHQGPQGPVPEGGREFPEDPQDRDGGKR